MVDNEFDGDAVETTQSQPVTAPRRRRAASRPAGPPPGTPDLPAQDSAPEPEPDAAPQAEPKAPRKRRSTAKSGAAVVVADQEQPAPHETPEASVAAEPAEAPVRRPATRRRAPRPEAAPKPVTAPEHEIAPDADPAPTTTPVAAGAPEVAPDAEPTAATEPTDAPVRRPATRRRASRPAAAPEPVPAPVAQAQVELVEAADTEVQEPSLESATKTASRRRRATRPAAAAAPVPEAEDAIAAALRMAEESVRPRAAVGEDKTNTLVEERLAQLDALAGAIASEDQEATEEVPEEPEDIETSVDANAKAEVHFDDEAGDDESDEPSSEDAAADEGDRGRRRRRRGGRRRRRASDRSDSDQSEDDAEHAEEPDAAEAADAVEAAEGRTDVDGSEPADPDGGESTTRRRRRRRRGSSGRGDDDAAEDTSDEVTGIEGSTRMEAKRQRRKENRAAGRRRTPILSEAEFLARRESVDRKLVIRQGADYTQLAVIEDGILVEHYVDKETATSLIGNVYLGKVQNVLPSMEAAFIDIGRGRNAVLYAGEVDWDSFGVKAEDRKVEKVLKSGQAILVQATKDPVGAKGARLTGHISLPGRYIVYSPGGHLSGISRKLPDVERARLKGILGELISDEESVVVRTAAEGIGAEELVRDVNRLKAQWDVIEKKVKQGKAPQALYSEPDLTLRIVRDLFNEDFGKLIVQGDSGSEDAYDAITAYVAHVAPHLSDRVERFTPGDDGRDVFAEFRIDEQIAKALDRKVFLPSGGSLVIDRTEAMTVIDVNTGRFTGAGGNLEATVTSNNLEAAEEIVRQLRLRDLGGIIVIDFIDMVLPSNRELLLRRLVECLARDRTRHQVAEVTSLGLVQLTRKRIGTGLAEAFTEKCECCGGSGYQRFEEPVESQAPADGGDRRQGGGPRGGRRRGPERSGGHGEPHAHSGQA